MKNQHNTFNEQEIDQRFTHAMRDEISDADINQFRAAFDQAWERRRWFQRLATRPFFVFLLFALTLTTTFATGYRWIKAETARPESALTPPILMPGQRTVDEPELLNLFPTVERPTLILMENETQKPKQSYLLHGYMEKDKIQVVWEY